VIVEFADGAGDAHVFRLLDCREGAVQVFAKGGFEELARVEPEGEVMTTLLLTDAALLSRRERRCNVTACDWDQAEMSMTPQSPVSLPNTMRRPSASQAIEVMAPLPGRRSNTSFWSAKRAASTMPSA
jgi:hypothetical protein